ncbi:ribose-phosphate diphosphokinase [Parvularcula lutaonensis]|uniref:ribose-phosphate diphosphokinase n=1 Tax=Parvularcula lutaonensis TaxID=491923 RepID=A0ABV7M8J0_9PROT|nr:ribose-phosphate diphosphokinase [Parvularcula lutaonensis]GGY56181.1 phosphoribosylpyrophosphate synthetase [Parvularcula lutaonensis]
MTKRVYSFFGSEPFADAVRKAIAGENGTLELRQFPDGESYLRFRDSLKGAHAVFIAYLDHPNDKTLPLLMAADAAKAQGAVSVGLAVPYLPYLRQDKAFKDGEAVTSLSFARLISGAFSWLATIDPHLHRYRDLSEVYSIPSTAESAVPALASWVRDNVKHPLIVGPDVESAQWIDPLAEYLGAPRLLFQKRRRGDREVEIVTDSQVDLSNHTPVIVDDIISSGHTTAETVRALLSAGSVAPVSIAVHGIFAEDAASTIVKAGAQRVVTTNTVINPNAAIDVAPILAAGVARMLGSAPENPALR